ncbi:MAG: hypothetical protein Q8L35_05675, partial [Actinomycetota bacterium]|nr:hypothetical protein [Actinomycetota bacterium]
ARGAAPTILIGLGEFGSDCVKRLQQTVDVAPEQLVALSLKAPESLSAGISLLNDEGFAVALSPGAGGTRAGIYEDFHTYSAPFEKWLRQSATKLLSQSGLTGPGGRIRVFIVCRAEEVGASALAVAACESIKSSLTEFISNCAVSLHGFFLLPKGRCRNGPQVFSMLNEINIGRSGYDKVWLVSEANAGGLIGIQGSVDLISEFAGLMLEPDFDAAVEEVLDVTGADIASFGITSVVHPVGRIVADESARFARELISSGLLYSGDEPFYRLADEYIKSERLNVDSLYGRLIADREGKVLDQVDPDSLALIAVPLAFWPDRIASYNAWLGHDRVPGLIEKLEKNLAVTSAEITATLKAKVDELMSEPSALEKTRHFIDRLAEKADELKSRVEQAKEEVMGRLPDLAGYHDDLVKQIQNRPGPAAAAGRGLLLIVIIFFFTVKFVQILRALPDQYLDPGYIPAARPTAVLAAVATAAFIWLIYRRAENRLYSARDRYLGAIGEKYGLTLSYHAFQVLSWWLGGTGSDELGERGLPSFKEIITNEQGAVVRINRFYLQISDKLKAKRIEIGETRVRRSVFSAFGQEADLRYKKGRYNLNDETQQFTAAGHQGWRDLQLTELNRRLDEFCRRGLDFVDNRSLDRLFLDFGQRRQVMSGVIEDLRRSSQPYIAVSSGLPRTTELVGLSGGTQSALVAQDALIGPAAVVPIWSPHRLAFVQLVSPITIEQLAAYSQWRLAYEAAPEKQGISCKKQRGRGGRAA